MNNIFEALGSKKNTTVVVSAHFLVWIVLFSLPYLLSSGQSLNVPMLVEHSWVPLCYYALIFYLNYGLLIDKLLFSKNRWYFLLANALLIAALIAVNQLVKPAFFSQYHTMPHGNFPPRKFFIYIDIVSMMIPLIFAIGLKISERWIKTEAERKEAMNTQLQSELQHLKYQLQPHFFFNSLNNIYSLVDISPEQAKETIHSLGKLMRYLLYETNAEKVSLSKEIDFMKNYIDLMKLRTSSKTQVHCQFPDVKTSIEIAPLLFISLVENAFKHGVSASIPTEIFLNMKIEDQQIFFESKTRNLAKTNSDLSNSGIGLDNLKKRLALLYPNRHHFSTKIAEPHFVAQLSIQY